MSSVVDPHDLTLEETDQQIRLLREHSQRMRLLEKQREKLLPRLRAKPKPKPRPPETEE